MRIYPLVMVVEGRDNVTYGSFGNWGIYRHFETLWLLFTAYLMVSADFLFSFKSISFYNTIQRFLVGYTHRVYFFRFWSRSLSQNTRPQNIFEPALNIVQIPDSIAIFDENVSLASI